MNEQLVQKPDMYDADHLALIIGLSCRNPLGFLYMWSHIFSFIHATRKARGCTEILPGVSTPFSILLVSYWASHQDLQAFVRSPVHRRWMRFIYKFPRSLNLFNETYSRPSSANFINKPRGYAGSLQKGKQP